MNIIYRAFFVVFILIFTSIPSYSADMVCYFEEYNEKVPDIKVHDIKLRLRFNDDTNKIKYLYFGKWKNVDSIIDYNYDFLLFRAKYKYPFGNTNITYKIDRLTNEIATYREETVYANKYYTVYYKGRGKCKYLRKDEIKL